MKSKTKDRLFYIVVISLVIAVAIGCFAYIIKDRNNFNKNKSEADKLLELSKTPEPVVKADIDSNLLRRIDFDELTVKNSDATRWLYVPGTKLDSPVMQEQVPGRYFYDLRGFNKQWNGCGSFLVPAHSGEISDAHTLILGHRMNSYNGEWQFSELPIRWGSKQGAEAYQYVYVYHKDRAQRWRVWAGMDADPEDMIYDTPYRLGSDDYENMLNHIAEYSRYTVGDRPTKTNETLILSTCSQVGYVWKRFALTCVLDAEYYYDEGRYVNVGDNLAYNFWKANWDENDKIDFGGFHG